MTLSCVFLSLVLHIILSGLFLGRAATNDSFLNKLMLMVLRIYPQDQENHQNLTIYQSSQTSESGALFMQRLFSIATLKTLLSFTSSCSRSYPFIQIVVSEKLFCRHASVTFTQMMRHNSVAAGLHQLCFSAHFNDHSLLQRGVRAQRSCHD